MPSRQWRMVMVVLRRSRGPRSGCGNRRLAQNDWLCQKTQQAVPSPIERQAAACFPRPVS